MLGRNQHWKTEKFIRWITAVVMILAAILLITTQTVSSDEAGNALEFDGVSNYVSLDRMTTVMGGTTWGDTMTVSLWAKPSAVPSPVTSPVTGELLIGTDRPRSFGITRADYNGQDRIWIWNSDGTGVDTIGVDYLADEWIHLVVVHDAGQWTVYKNGLEVGSIPSNTTVVATRGDLYLGGNSRGQRFSGELDEVRLWNAALSQTIIQGWQYQHLSALHPNWNDLAAYYQMSNGSGVTLSDDSSNGHSGSLLGGMTDTNWVLSTAFGGTMSTPTPSATAVPGTPTNTPVPPTPTETAVVPPTVTSTNTAVPPTATATALPPTATPPPIPGYYALSFDGVDDMVELGPAANIIGNDWQNTKTVSFWVKTAGSAPVVGQVVSGYGIFVDHPRWFGLYQANVGGEDKLWVINYDNGDLPGNDDTLGFDYTPGVWTHVAMVHANEVMTVYKDGVPVGSFATGTTANGHPGWDVIEFRLGGFLGNYDTTFAGEIDEVRIWDSPRTQVEIQVDMHLHIDGNTPGLAAYYRMSTGFGSTLVDNSYNGHDGTILGSPTWISPGAVTDTLPPTATPTTTAVPPTATNTPMPPTATSVAPTATNTPASVTATPTAVVIPTETMLPPTVTPTAVPTTPTATPDGGAFLALEFNGIDDHVYLGDTGDLFGNTDWIDNKVVSVWVMPADNTIPPATHPASGEVIVGNDRPGTFGISLANYQNADRLWVWNADADGVDTIGIDFTPGEWVQIALVHENGILSAYRNGLLVGSVASGTTAVPNHNRGDGKLYIGGNGRSDTIPHFSGKIDEVRLWNTSFSGTTLSSWTFQTVDTGHPNWLDLSAYYQMNDGVGLLLTDNSANNRTGDLLGSMLDSSWVPSGAFTTAPLNVLNRSFDQQSAVIILENIDYSED